jgi:D-xylonolactonase
LNIITSEPKVIWNSKTILGEGTLWVPSHNSIYFVDIKKKKILTLNIKTNKKRIIKIDKEIGFLAHIKKYFYTWFTIRA